MCLRDQGEKSSWRTCVSFFTGSFGGAIDAKGKTVTALCVATAINVTRKRVAVAEARLRAKDLGKERFSVRSKHGCGVVWPTSGADAIATHAIE